MTYRDAMMVLISKTDAAEKAAKIVRRLQTGDREQAEKQAVKLIRAALAGDTGELTKHEIAELQTLATVPDAPIKNVIFQFRCSEQERAAIHLLAAKYAEGNASKLILNTLQERYPTL